MSNCKTINIGTPPKLMSIKAAMKYLGVSRYFIESGIKNGTVPFIRSGCKYYIAVDVLMDSIKAASEEKKPEINA